MEIRQLRAFVAVAEELHFRRASERLHLTQPALSKQIRALEEALGESLFHRTRQQVRLTPAGAAFVGPARDILDRLRLAQDAVKLAARGRTGRLEIGFCQGMEMRTLPRAVRRFRRRFPQVEVGLHPMSSPEQVDGVRRGRIDLGFVHLPVKNHDVAVEPLGREPFLLVSPEDHPLSKCPEPTVAALADVPFILLARHQAPVYHDLVLSLAREAGVTLAVKAEARSFHETLGLVAAGLGVSLLPQSAREHPWKGVAYCRLKPPGPELERGLVFRVDGAGEIVANFLEVARTAG